MEEGDRETLRGILGLLQAISLEDGPYADYEEDRLNAIADLEGIIYPGVAGGVLEQPE